MSLLIEDTNEIYALNSLDADYEGDSQLRPTQMLVYKNDDGKYEDSLHILKKNDVRRYENGVEVVYNYVELTLNVRLQQFTNSTDITASLNAYLTANDRKGKLMISDNADKGSPEKYGNLYFQIDHIYKVEECN